MSLSHQTTISEGRHNFYFNFTVCVTGCPTIIYTAVIIKVVKDVTREDCVKILFMKCMKENLPN